MLLGPGGREAIARRLRLGVVCRARAARLGCVLILGKITIDRLAEFRSKVFMNHDSIDPM